MGSIHHKWIVIKNVLTLDLHFLYLKVVIIIQNFISKLWFVVSVLYILFNKFTYYYTLTVWIGLNFASVNGGTAGILIDPWSIFDASQGKIKRGELLIFLFMGFCCANLPSLRAISADPFRSFFLTAARERIWGGTVV